MQLYSVELPDRSGSITRLSEAVTGIFDPETSPAARWIAANLYRVDGYHLGVAPIPGASIPDTVVRGNREACVTCRVIDAAQYDAGPPSNATARRYSPWRSLLPTYWEPIVESSTGEGTLFGAATSGNDVIGIHSYAVQATYGTKFKQGEGFVAYRYAGFGQPFLDLSGEQIWDHFDLVNSNNRVVGDFAQLSRIYSGRMTFVRPRVRTSASLSLGGEIERRDYSTDPDTLLKHLGAVFREPASYPSVVATAGWTNTRRPPLAISREDGIAVSLTARERWRRGATEEGASNKPSHAIVGTSAAYKSLDLPGFAHHVIALRGAAGYTDGRTISTFSAGGLSGTSIEVLAGYGVGDSRRTFGVRGFPPSAERGIRAFAGSLEYRAPIAAPSRHIRFIPLLFDRISASAFADAGRAYCPRSAVDKEAICTEPATQNPWLSSVGAELNLDAALYYDFPARLRFGVAVPTSGREATGAKRASAYLTFGSSF
jgi:hypothetical protein